MKVTNLKEAEGFFLNNSSGSVCCVKEGKDSKDCNSYIEAKEFYEEDK